jgi:hypothetical protein
MVSQNRIQGTEFGRLLIIIQVYNRLCRSLTEFNIQNNQNIKNMISLKLFRVNLFSHGSNNTNTHSILFEETRPFTAGPENLCSKK